ncbi:MAG: TIGR00282 family metallophosphoesterase [Kiritimatiellae bacterium]|jgi:metallophosphoesterase (TIGR00282 family)|nr:TIGR00282 family metallophosphoesterase [Kiritimatiellia bacterium]MDD3441146.1 TIGR00282 family metallophosphoesterase [Kiritimatiellia bacterium]MDD4117385.1 TIGR00282 family metallophosphoesterase [Kiritimatiellia bacterium]NCC92208.1 TIGR00282 family metallophosphoesterase [Opitutae bacterium]
MKILFVGDIVGGPGRMAMARVATRYKADKRADVVVANAENSAAGRGITAALAEELFAGGADLLTMGDHVWDQKQAVGYFDQEPRIVRALNLPPGCPGKGEAVLETPAGPLAVVQLMGRTFMNSLADCPFRTIEAWLKKNASRYRMILVDMHAEATSEKVAMGKFLDGRVTAVIGTHTHIQTADEAVTAKGTAYLTDAGMTGPCDSVIGRTTDAILGRFLTGMPTKFEIASGDVRLHGALLTVDPATGKALKIKRIEEILSK